MALCDKVASPKADTKKEFGMHNTFSRDHTWEGKERKDGKAEDIKWHGRCHNASVNAAESSRVLLSVSVSQGAKCPDF